MSYPFSIVGTIIYVFYVTAVVGIVVMPLAVFILKNKNWKWFVISPIAVALIAAPVAEELWIEYRFENLCEDSGIHIKRKVKVDGYLNATYLDPSRENKIIDDPEKVKQLLKEGFGFKEVTTINGKIRHREVKDGKVVQTIIDKPRSRYYLLHTHNHYIVGYKITKMQFVVKDSYENEIIGRDTKYARYPGIIESLWIRFIGDGQIICRDPKGKETKRIGQINKYIFLPLHDSCKNRCQRPIVSNISDN